MAWVKAVGSALLVAVSFAALGSCSPGPGSETSSEKPQPATELSQPPFAWMPAEPGKVIAEGPPAKLDLSQGLVFLLYPSTSAGPGDEMRFEMTISSASQGPLRAVLMRHCGEGSEMDSASETFEVGPTPRQVSLRHKFAEAHPCIRVLFQSPDSTLSDVSIQSWRLIVPGS